MAVQLSSWRDALQLSLAFAVLASCSAKPTETASAEDVEAEVKHAERDVPVGATTASAGTVTSSASDLTVLD